MSIKTLFEKILDKWPAKIICLVIAVFLYFFHQASLIDTKTFVVPLTIIEDGMVMHVGTVPRSVSVVVRAEEDAVKSVSISDLTASINLDTITQAGSYKLPIKITLSDRLMEYDPFEVKIKEDTIKIDVDLKTMKYVPIDPYQNQIGEVADGYEIDSIEISPSTVEIMGPASIVAKTDKIYTSKLNVSNAETNFSTEVTCKKPNAFITVLDEGPFKATVSLRTKMMEKEFDSIAVDVVNLDSSLTFAEPLPLISIKLSGSMPVLDNYVVSPHLVQLDCSEIKGEGTYELPLNYSIPSNLHLVEKSDDELAFTIVIKKADENHNEKAEAGE